MLLGMSLALGGIGRAVGDPPVVGNLATINAILDASLTAVIPTGTYTINGTLNVDDNHVITTSGGPVVLIADAAYSGRFIEAVFVDFTIDGVTFDGNYANRSALEGLDTASVIYTSGSDYSVTNCIFRRCPAFAIWTYNNQVGTTITGNTFLECYHPIRIDANAHAGGLIQNNWFVNTSSFKSIQHVECMSCTSLSILDNTFSGVGLNEPTSHGFEGTWGNSIYLWNAIDDITITGNTLYPSYWSAIVIGAGATNAVIHDNPLISRGSYSPATVAIWVEQAGADIVDITDNVIDGDIAIGDSGGNNATITGNTITGYQYGINLNAACEVATVSYNTVTCAIDPPGPTNWGMYLWQKNVITVNLQIHHNTYVGWTEGIWINNSGGVGTVYGIDIYDNTFTDCDNSIGIPPEITIDPSCSGF